jgi:hypothetical protein
MLYTKFLRDLAARTNEKLHKMSSKQYIVTEVDEDGSEHVTISENAFLTHDNISKMTFKYAKPMDITDSLTKSNKKPGAGFTSKSGRVAHSAGSCVYPDGSSSSKVAIAGCVLDYRPKAKDDYGRRYVAVGIPVGVCEQIKKGAQASASINLQVPPKAGKTDGYYWVSVNLEKMDAETSKFMFSNDSGDVQFVPIGIRPYLDMMEGNVNVIMFASIGASQTTTGMDEMPDLKGAFNLTFKPNEFYLQDKSDVKSPEFSFEAQSKERIQMSSQLLASDALANMVLANLNISR